MVDTSEEESREREAESSEESCTVQYSTVQYSIVQYSTVPAPPTPASSARASPGCGPAPRNLCTAAAPRTSLLLLLLLLLLWSQLLVLCHWCAWPGPVTGLVLVEAGTGGGSQPHVSPATGLHWPRRHTPRRLGIMGCKHDTDTGWVSQILHRCKTMLQNIQRSY